MVGEMRDKFFEVAFQFFPIVFALFMLNGALIVIAKGTFAPAINESELVKFSGVVKKVISERSKGTILSYKLIVANDEQELTFKIMSKLVRKKQLLQTVSNFVSVKYNNNHLAFNEVYVLEASGISIIRYKNSRKLIHKKRTMDMYIGIGFLVLGLVIIYFGVRSVRHNL